MDGKVLAGVVTGSRVCCERGSSEQPSQRTAFPRLPPWGKPVHSVVRVDRSVAITATWKVPLSLNGRQDW